MHQVLGPLSLVASLLVVSGARAIAQQASIVIRVQVVDTAGAPVADANVAVLQGLNDVLSSGTTDVNGGRVFVVPRRTGDYQLTARRIGFQRTDRFIGPPRMDTVAVRLELRRVPQTLERVTVSERESIKRRRYHIDADAIAASQRPIFDAMDVVVKLRPDMLRGLSGTCPLRYYWVNGRRIRPLPVAVDRRTSILGSIKPEHIAEVNYTDCFDNTVQHIGNHGAVYVVLKPGIDFEQGIGSFVKFPVDTQSTVVPRPKP